MLTIYIMSIISFVVCYVRISNECKRQKTEFDPTEGSFLELLGFILSLSTALVCTIIIAIDYLP